MFEYSEKHKDELKGMKVRSTLMIGGNELKPFLCNGSGFDSWNVLKSLPTCWRIVNPIKTAKALISVKIV